MHLKTGQLSTSPGLANALHTIPLNTVKETIN